MEQLREIVGPVDEDMKEMLGLREKALAEGLERELQAKTEFFRSVPEQRRQRASKSKDRQQRLRERIG